MSHRLHLLRSVSFAVACFAAVATGGSAIAQEAESLSELKEAIAARDALIVDMLDRIEALEARLAGASTVHGAETAAPEGRTAAAPASYRAATASDVAPTEAPRTAARAPGTLEVDEEAAERALERSLVQAGAVLLPRGRVEIEPSFAYSRAESSTPVVLATAPSTVVGEARTETVSYFGALGLRLGLPFDSQFEASLPYRRIRDGEDLRTGFVPLGSASSSGKGFGDLRVGLAKTLLREAGWLPDVVARATWDTATGDDSDNGVFLGGGFDEVGGSLTLTKTQDPLVFVSRFGYEHAFEDDGIKPGAQFDIGLAAFLALNPHTSVDVGMNFLRAEETEVGGVSIAGTDQSAWSIDYGLSSVLGQGVVLNLFGGFGITDDAPDVTLGVSLPIRFNSGL